MPDPITVNEANQWAFDLSGGEGGNQERFEALAGFDDVGAFVDSHFDGLNKDWREGFGEDEATVNTLKRYSTPQDFGKAHMEARSQLAKGFTAPKLAENATDEDIAAFRTAQGIPLTPEGYLENLPDGLVIGEEDQPIVEHFNSVFHGLNASPEIVHGILAGYNEFAEAQQAELAETDQAQFKETEDVLRAPVEDGGWGQEYRANINIAGAMLAKTFGAEAAEAIQNARGPDGRAIMNTPAILAGFAQLARQLDPLVQIIPNDTGDAIKTLHEEIASIEKVMTDDRPAYNKDEKMQARLRELYDIRSKHDAAA